MVNISKELLFCDANFIEKELNKLFLKLKSENYLKDCTEDNIASKAAYYLGESMPFILLEKAMAELKENSLENFCYLQAFMQIIQDAMLK